MSRWKDLSLVLSGIIGAALAFVAAAFDGLMSFGNASFTRFIIVFLISWPIGALFAYAAVKDTQELWNRLRNPRRK